MSSRSFRLETRSRARDEIKRIMQTVEKVRKWEKIWIETGLSNHLKVYKWVPVREETKEGMKEDDQGSHNESQSVDIQNPAEASGDTLLPEIQPVKENTLETPQLSTDQLPPDLLLASDETNDIPTTAEGVTEGSVATSNMAASDDSMQQGRDLEKRQERQAGSHEEEEDSRPRSPH